MLAPCNPWGGDVGDDLSFTMPTSCSARRDDDLKKLSSAQQSDNVSSEVSRRGVTLSGRFDTGVMVKIVL